MFHDPSGLYNSKVYETLYEVNVANSISSHLRAGLNVFNLFKANAHATTARDNAVQYAKDNNFYTNGTLVTWDNVADAHRHFLWNALMTRDISQQKAQIIADAHEIAPMVNNSLGEFSLGMDASGKATYTLTGYFSAATLMDFHNNKIGRTMAANSEYAHLSADQLFSLAKDQGLLILSTNDSFKHFGLDSSYITSNSNVYGQYDRRSGAFIFYKVGTY